LGLEELLSSLKKNEQKQIDDIWGGARAEADIIRHQVAEEIANNSREHEEQLTSACRKSVRAILSEADIKAREKKLYAYQKLEKALYEIAISQLFRLREYNYKEVFSSLVKELPERQWEKIVVNPSDAELAAKFYDSNIVQADQGIIGGLKALAATGKVFVDNTFEKRLERKWPYILPAIIKKTEEQYEETDSFKNI